jgi:HTH-type transcriptional regulator/antitoxin HipB
VDYPVKTLSQLRPILVGFRKSAGLTQEAVAQRLGISQQSYAAFEANPETASVERFFRVLRLFDVGFKLGAPEATEAPVSPAAARPARAPAAAAKMAGKTVAGKTAAVKKVASKTAAGKTAASPARKRPRTTQAAGTPSRKAAPTRKTRENW